MVNEKKAFSDAENIPESKINRIKISRQIKKAIQPDRSTSNNKDVSAKSRCGGSEEILLLSNYKILRVFKMANHHQIEID